MALGDRFPILSEAFSGIVRAVESARIDDLGSPRGKGRGRAARDSAVAKGQDGSPVALVAREAGRQEAGEIAVGGQVEIVPGLACRGLWKTSKQLTPCGHTPCVPCGGWRGAAPPLTPAFPARHGSGGRPGAPTPEPRRGGHGRT